MNHLLAHIRCLLMVTDRSGIIKALSADMAALSAVSEIAIVGQSMTIFLPPAGRIFMQTHVWPTLLKFGELLEGYLSLRHHQHGDIPVMFNAHIGVVDEEHVCYWVFFPIKDRSRFEAELIAARAHAQDLARKLREANQALEAANHDLRLKTELIEAHNHHLQELSQTDVLTGVGNRRALQSAFQLWQRNQLLTAPNLPATASLLMVDADHFKRINDTWGHDEGDRVLVALAIALRSSVRSTDHVNRFGGEEFVIWLPQASTDAANRIAEEIHHHVHQIIPGTGSETLTVSIGQVTLTGEPGQMDLSYFLKLADQAVYKAKLLGRNRSVIASELERQRGEMNFS